MNLQLTLPISILLLTACANSLSQDRDPRVGGKTVAVPQGITADPVWQKLGGCNVLGQSYLRTQQCWTLEAAKLPPFDPGKPEHFGELYDPQKFLECKLQDPRNSACDRFALRRPENPEYWPPGSKKITWSAPPKESVYREGMNGREYFAALCQAEAGEFIYKTVENVEGIYQIRPRTPQESNPELMDRYVMEDPYGRLGLTGSVEFEMVGDRVLPKWVKLDKGITSKRYVYLESPAEFFQPKPSWSGYRDSSYFQAKPDKTNIIRFSGFSGDDGDMRSMLVRYDTKANSRYGFTWRGITRPHDRELGIAGGELAVVDLETGEILGIRRGFQYSASKSNKTIWWLGGLICPDSGGFPINHQFIFRVAKPAGLNRGDNK